MKEYMLNMDGPVKGTFKSKGDKVKLNDLDAKYLVMSGFLSEVGKASSQPDSLGDKIPSRNKDRFNKDGGTKQVNRKKN